MVADATEWGVSGGGCLFLYSEWGWGGEGGMTKGVRPWGSVGLADCMSWGRGSVGLSWNEGLSNWGEEFGLRECECRLLKSEEMRDYRIRVRIFIYTGYFCNFRCRVFNQARSRVFLIKPEPDPDSLRVFFFLNPYLTLFLIGPGKTRSIRVGPGTHKSSKNCHPYLF